jgi:hypothetical protein
VDLATLADPLLKAPTYRVVSRLLWTGVRHTALYADLRALIIHWRAACCVVDATGVGAGLASFLHKALPGVVVPFTFNSSTKSSLGWDFLSLIDSGRYKEYQDSAGAEGYGAMLTQGAGEAYNLASLQALFFRQAQYCAYQVQPGPGKRLSWGVPDGQRDPETGSLLHDDLLLSAALCARLDTQPWPAGTAPVVIPARDPLDDMDREGY